MPVLFKSALPCTVTLSIVSGPVAVKLNPPLVRASTKPPKLFATSVSITLPAVVLIALLLAVEHALVRPSDLSKLNRAFFDINGYVSVAFFLCVALDQWLR